MEHTFYSTNFHFNTYCGQKYRYTDARDGATMHYIGYMRKGSCRIESREGMLMVAQGDIFYIPASLPYQSHWYGEDRIEFESFGFFDFPEAMDGQYALQRFAADEKTLELIDAIARNPQVCSRTLGKFFALLSLLLPQMTMRHKEARYSKTIHEAAAYLTVNPRASIAQIAKHCNVSESGLYNAFRREGDMSPNDLRHKILAEKAVHLLQTTDLSVEQISRQLEFSSSSYFRKILFSVTGKTPRQLRRESSAI